MIEQHHSTPEDRLLHALYTPPKRHPQPTPYPRRWRPQSLPTFSTPSLDSHRLRSSRCTIHTIALSPSPVTPGPVTANHCVQRRKHFRFPPSACSVPASTLAKKSLLSHPETMVAPFNIIVSAIRLFASRSPMMRRGVRGRGCSLHTKRVRPKLFSGGLALP